MSDQTKIGIIGFGNMGSAIYESLIEKYPIESIYACDRNLDNLRDLRLKVNMLESTSLISKVDVIIIAVKPQEFEEFAQECLNSDISEKIVISIMAGVSMEKLQSVLGVTKVVRSMPNLAIKHKKGITGWIGSKDLTIYDRVIISNIFDTMGKQIEVLDESMLDKITALSGSGPAYYFHFVNLMQKKANELGFSEEESKVIAEDTFLGAAEILKNDNKSASQLISSIASKGGTTQAALNSFKKNELDHIFLKGIDAAYKKSKELNKS